jgi:hypothetical protein
LSYGEESAPDDSTVRGAPPGGIAPNCTFS